MAENDDDRSQPFSPCVKIIGNCDSIESEETTPLVGEDCSVNRVSNETLVIRKHWFKRLLLRNEQKKACDRMRNELHLFFMSPFKKWEDEGCLPLKLMLQGVIIVLSTLQLWWFGSINLKHMNQHIEMTKALSRIFLKDESANVAVCPPDNVPYALHRISEFYDNINYAIKQFTKISADAIGPYDYDNENGTLTSIDFCVKSYTEDVFPGNSTIVIHNLPAQHCEIIPPLYPASSELWENFTIQHFLREKNITLDFKTIIKVSLHFQLRTIFIKSMSKLEAPECYRLKLELVFDNGEHDGHVAVSFIKSSIKVDCSVRSEAEPDSYDNVYYILSQILDAIVISVCVVSAILCLVSLCYGFMILIRTAQFFKISKRNKIPKWELIDFIDLWYLNNVISDCMLISGSIFKLQIQEHSANSSDYLMCSILMGVGYLLNLVGLLRYLGFCPKYTMLILILKKTLPNILHFSLCVCAIFVGFLFCGWVVLAPYHIKFRTRSLSAECLLAIMTGDNVFDTLALTDDSNSLIWWFSRIYLYVFFFLFVYVLISLFMSVIMDTFNIMKNTYKNGSLPLTTVEQFLREDSYTPVQFQEGEYNHWKKAWVRFKLQCI